MSVTNVPSKIQRILWGRAAGRCEYAGCNRPLWKDDLTQAEFNSSYVAHIMADSPDGPRGDAVLSDQLKAELSNLMLLCDVHHRLVDIAEVAKHPAEVLRSMKQAHESRVELQTSIAPDKRSTVLLYGANIGELGARVAFGDAAVAMMPESYPEDANPISLGTKNSAFYR